MWLIRAPPLLTGIQAKRIYLYLWQFNIICISPLLDILCLIIVLAVRLIHVN